MQLTELTQVESCNAHNVKKSLYFIDNFLNNHYIAIA